MIRYRDHVRFMRSSVAAFDAGDHAEALRIATSVRVLLHDTSHSRSLLRQLGVKDAIVWRTFRPPSSFNAGATVLLDSSHYGFEYGQNGMTIGPIDLGPAGRFVPFTEWWSEHTYKSGATRILRSNVVLGLANQDGGAHVDIAKGFLPALLASAPQVLQADESPVGAVEQLAFARDLVHIQMRSIASEVLHSLERAESEGVL